MLVVTDTSYRRHGIAFGKLALALTLAVIGVLLGPATATDAATITVTTTADTTTVDGGVSLREAITSVNTGANLNADVVAVGAYGTADTINFAIPAATDSGCVVGTGVCTIAVAAGGLPTISRTVTIDGYTQPGASPNTLVVGNNAALKIELNGASAGVNVDGIVIDAANTTISGLIVNRFAGTIKPPAEQNASGILVNTGGSETRILGNRVGTNAAGTNAVGGLVIGIQVIGAPNVIIGGSTAGARNVVSGHVTFGISVHGAGATGAQIQGNYVGTNATGTGAIASVSGIMVRDAPGVTVGGLTATARNVVSGHLSSGIYIFRDLHLR